MDFFCDVDAGRRRGLGLSVGPTHSGRTRFRTVWYQIAQAEALVRRSSEIEGAHEHIGPWGARIRCGYDRRGCVCTANEHRCGHKPVEAKPDMGESRKARRAGGDRAGATTGCRPLCRPVRNWHGAQALSRHGPEGRAPCARQHSLFDACARWHAAGRSDVPGQFFGPTVGGALSQWLMSSEAPGGIDTMLWRRSPRKRLPVDALPSCPFLRRTF